MAYVLDAAVILILVLGIVWGYRRGFVKTAAQTIGCVAAILIAYFASGVLAQTVYDTMIDKPLKAYASEQMLDATGVAIETQLDETLEEMPRWTRNMLKRMGYASSEDIVEKLEPSADATAADIVDDLLRSPVISVVRLIVFLILFLVLMVVVTLMSKLLRRIFRFPLLRQVDGLLGIIPGILVAVLWIMALTTAMQLYVSLAAEPKWVTDEVLKDSVLVRLAISWNPLTNTVQSFLA